MSSFVIVSFGYAFWKWDRPALVSAWRFLIVNGEFVDDGFSDNDCAVDGFFTSVELSNVLVETGFKPD